MAERTSTQALETYLAPRRLAISCLTPRILTMPSGLRLRSGLVDVVLGNGEPVRLRGPERIHLRVRMRVRLSQAEASRGLWEAETAAYDYLLSDVDDREILAYHWHPEGQSHATIDAAGNVALTPVQQFATGFDTTPFSIPSGSPASPTRK